MDLGIIHPVALKELWIGEATHFTPWLAKNLDVLASNAEILDGQRLGLEVAARVSYAASNARVEQDPQYAPIRYAGHEAGDFLFVPTIVQ